MESYVANIECRFPRLAQSVDPLRQHPGHQGERPAAAGEAQQRLEEGVRGAGGVPALHEGRPLLENKDGGGQHAAPAGPAEPAAATARGQREDGPAGADGRSRVQHLVHQQRAGPTCKCGPSREWMPLLKLVYVMLNFTDTCGSFSNCSERLNSQNRTTLPVCASAPVKC